MKTSCISHPSREPLVIIRKSQVDFCEDNQCAAAVMSYLEYWHNWKLDSDEYSKKTNNISEMHGEGRPLTEDVYQYHSLQEICDGILNLYASKTVSAAIKFLESKKVITTHRNPNPRYHYDKTTYFRFYPEVYNEWLNAYKTGSGNFAASTKQKSVTDAAKLPDGDGKNAAPYGKNAAPITEINNKDINQSLKDAENFFNEGKKITQSAQLIVNMLLDKGMALERFHYPDVMPMIEDLITRGATVDIFVEAYELAEQITQNSGFGIRYLAKTVNHRLLAYKRKSSSSTRLQLPTKTDEEQIYENDLKNLTWMEENDGTN